MRALIIATIIGSVAASAVARGEDAGMGAELCPQNRWAKRSVYVVEAPSDVEYRVIYYECSAVGQHSLTGQWSYGKNASGVVVATHRSNVEILKELGIMRGVGQ